MRATSAQDRAVKVLAKVDERIAAVDARRAKAVAKVDERYAGELVALESEREHAAAHPALQAVGDVPAKAFAAGE